MTTLISKVLTVFVTVASVAFMAVAIASHRAGGPNWVAKSKELPEVAFERAGPDSPWTAKKRIDASDMGGGPILAAAILNAQKKLIDAERTAQTDLDQKINLNKGKITEVKAQIAADLDAMQRRQTDLDTQYADVRKKLDVVSQDYTQEAKKQIEDLDVLKLRAEEYVRVKNQLDELRAQREVASDDLDRLQALLYQAKANLGRAKMRQRLLGEDGADVGPYDSKPPQANAEKAVEGEKKPDEAKPAANEPDAEKEKVEKEGAEKTE